MKFNVNQRRMYLLALGLLILAIVLACTWLLLRGEDEQVSLNPSPSPAAAAEPPVMPRIDDEMTAANASPTQKPAQKASTIVYYQDNDGYLVPVMCSVPMEDGIAKATLNLMVKNTGNDMQAAIDAAKIANENGTKVLYDAGGLYERVGELLPYSDILIPSEEFALGHTGAETAEEVAALQAQGVDRIQGYALARPMPEDKLLAFYREHPLQP